MKDRLKEIRKLSPYGKNQESFAKYLGIPQTNLASYETGRRKPSDAFVQLICEKCNVNEEWFRTGKGEMYKRVEDEVAAIVSDLLEEDNPFYNLIIGIMKTYQKLDSKSQEALNNLGKELLNNIKKEG